MNKELIVIEGPTAIGKTAVSIRVAEILKTEILSADSRQMYREMSIGTAVPSIQDQKKIKHHFIQHISVRDYYNASRFENDANHLLDSLFKNYEKVIMTGGSGLYIDAVCSGIDDLPEIDPEVRLRVQEQFNTGGIESLLEDLIRLDPRSFDTIDLNNPKRIQKALEICIITGKPYSSFLTAPQKKRNYTIRRIALDMERSSLYDRINKRVDGMFTNGLVEEAETLYPMRSFNALNTVGYRELFEYFDGKTTLGEAREKIKSNTRNYARKQLTWFRKHKDNKWFHPDDFDGILKYILP